MTAARRLLLVEDEPGLIMTLTDRLLAEGVVHPLHELVFGIGLCEEELEPQLGEVPERRPRDARARRRPGDGRLTARGPDEADGDLDERRLAGAVRTEEPDELALLDGVRVREVAGDRRTNRDRSTGRAARVSSGDDEEAPPSDER